MQSTAPLGSLSVAPTSLAAAFAAVPDTRRARSVIDPVSAILTLTVAALSDPRALRQGRRRTRRAAGRMTRSVVAPGVPVFLLR